MPSAAGGPRCSVWLPSGVPCFVCSTGCRLSLGSIVDDASCVSSRGAKKCGDRRSSRRNNTRPLSFRTAVAGGRRWMGGELSPAHVHSSPWSLPGGQSVCLGCLKCRCVQQVPFVRKSERNRGGVAELLPQEVFLGSRTGVFRAFPMLCLCGFRSLILAGGAGTPGPSGRLCRSVSFLAT